MIIREGFSKKNDALCMKAESYEKGYNVDNSPPIDFHKVLTFRYI